MGSPGVCARPTARTAAVTTTRQHALYVPISRIWLMSMERPERAVWRSTDRARTSSQSSGLWLHRKQVGEVAAIEPFLRSVSDSGKGVLEAL
jgi:hypothetical protein